ncbi:IS701 family transposase [Kitasatospora sp. NPDC127111]|uniref:IS701 family transposase n=1 Tax=Kitasatospora sp. NPDC127111 TaxID=3345363 RepID=UPI0036341D32
MAEVWDRELTELFLRIGTRFTRVEPRRRMRDYVRGLLGPVGRKNSWQLAEFGGHPAPHRLQHLLARACWSADGVRDDLQAYIGEQLGTPDGVLILDDTGFVKKGTVPAGVQRQYSGTAGRTENRQIGVFAAYAWTKGHALVDRELDLPKSWTDDRQRCQGPRVPDERGRRPGLALPAVPRRRRALLRRCRPKSQQVHGPRIDFLIAQAPPEAWQRLSAGSEAKGERLYDWAAARLPAVWEFDGDQPTRQRWMLARRSIARPDDVAYYLACAPLDATVADLVRVAGCRWKIEECFQSAKNECGLDQYEMRPYVGWYRHITLAMLAHAFLAVMAAREREKGAAATTRPTSWTSPRPRFAVCWQLDPATVLRTATTH